jgi:hypothetical protein
VKLDLSLSTWVENKMTKESSLENWFCESVKSRGGHAIKLTFIKGIPDRLVLMPYGRAAFVELKTAIGSPSKLQTFWREKLIRMGFTCMITDSKETLTALLDTMAKP